MGPRTSSAPKPHIGVMGTWNWLEVAAELLRRAGMTCETIPDPPSRRSFVEWVLRGHWRRFDAIHHVRGTSWSAGATFAVIDKPAIWHWIGTDALRYGRIHRRGGGWRGALSRRAVRHWSRAHLADSPELAEELAGYGIRAEVVRLLPRAIETGVQPLPEAPCVLSYWAANTREFYHAHTVLKLAGAFPETPFLIVGDDGKGMEAPKNVRFLGRLPNLADIYSQVSVYVRLVEHDSLSAMVLEALARGRYVVYSKEFPFAENVRGLVEAREALARLSLQRHPNRAGAEYVREHYSLRKEADKLGRLYAQWFPRARENPLNREQE